MTTPQQFLEAFLKEKATIYAEANARLGPVHIKYFGETLLRRAGDFLLRDRQAVDEVKQSGSSAVIITRAHFATGNIRMRYHLAAVGETWRIVRIDRKCFVCRGTGSLGHRPAKNAEGKDGMTREKMAAKKIVGREFGCL